MIEINQIICGDCLTVMPAWDREIADCCVTSPPYWGLRDYGLPPTKWPDGSVCCYGLEPTPELYVSHTVLIFAEVWRVLKPEGTLWLNLGDSYVSSPVGHKNAASVKKSSTIGMTISDEVVQGAKFDKTKVPGLKTKDLVGIPWMVAFALRSAGWYLRQDIIWHKPNPMPESVRDRCTKAHEYIFLLTKQPRYYCDMDAIKEPTERNWADVGGNLVGKGVHKQGGHYKDIGDRTGGEEKYGRNKRSVWTVTTKPYSEAHFATFPPDLIEPCILAGCPEWVCKKCGKARERIIEKGELVPDNPSYKPRGNNRGDSFVKNAMTPAGETQGHPNHHYEQKTTGWTDCGCGAGFSPGLVLDPFMGASTTALVAYKNRRNYIGCELNPEYIRLGNKRVQDEREKFGLFENSSCVVPEPVVNLNKNNLFKEQAQ